MKKIQYITLLAMLLSLSTGLYAQEDHKSKPDVSQVSEHALQMFMILRNVRLEQFQAAMQQVAPYLRDGLTTIESREILHHRIANVSNASRVAGSLASLNGGSIPAMRIFLQQQKQSEANIIKRLPQLMEPLAPAENAIQFAKYEILFDAVNLLYLYINLHWESWDAKNGSFKPELLQQGFQQLTKEVSEAMNLLVEN
ncbi:MAG: hypothetical protein Q9M20_04315 [Mariprofundaceae bacterium]|nr:hypothetical protein [Mariprofundaceae bacterium]